MTTPENRRTGPALYLLLLVAIIELFSYLGGRALFWDEAIYAQVSKEIVERGEWLNLHWNGQLWFHKPPLYLWSTAVLFKIFGVGETWARVTSALAGLGVVWVTFVTARAIYGTTAAFLAGLILLSTPLFIVYARFGTTDLLLTFFIMLAIYAYVRSRGDQRFWAIAWLACALAIMVKGVAAIVAPVALVLAEALNKDRRSYLQQRSFWLGLSWAVLIVLSWHGGMYYLHGREFLDNYIGHHILTRSVSDLHRYNHGYGFYAWVLWEFFFPWVCLAPLAIIFEFRRKQVAVFLTLTAVVICLYTIAKTKFPWYILPVIPALAIVIAGFVSNTLKRLPPLKRQLTYGVVAFLFIAGLWTTVPHLRPQQEMESAARLARLAAADAGMITTYPEDLEMTVMFYSNRRICAHPDLSPLAYSESTVCEPGEPRGIIFRKNERTRVEAFYPIETRHQDGDLEYGLIKRAR